MSRRLAAQMAGYRRICDECQVKVGYPEELEPDVKAPPLPLGGRGSYLRAPAGEARE